METSVSLDRVTVEPLGPTTNDRLDEVIRLLALLAKAQGIRTQPVKPMTPQELEGWKRIGREFGDIARLQHEQRQPTEVDVFDESSGDNLPPSGGTPPERVLRRRR